MVFIKPESALKRADELIDVGKKQRALETLLEVIKSRRHRTWTKIHEPLMEKLLELCVDLKKSAVAKDALHQYKTIAQSVSVKSLEDVIMKFIKLGEERCTNAREEAKNVCVEIDDLEVLQTPESLLLSAVSGESQQDRTDRDMLAPWLKFVWESYKQCLDLLKNNNRVEKIYQDVAQMGFRFCQQYNRRTEFRKLCETIRSHLSQSQKYSQQTYSVNFQSAETQALHLETRLVQLDTAIEMELWQEAFKAIEDIHTFTTISKKTPKPHQLAAYYNKIALVFWKAGNYVFHATTVLRLYVLHKEQKKTITQEELTRLSTKALLSILSIPLPAPRTQIDEHLETEETINEKQKRLTSLLSLQQVPTRASLIRDMIKQGVLNFVYPELRNLYEWLEIEFHPLRLSTKMEEGIQFVENQLAQPEYSQYMPALRDVTVVRLLQQVSQVYQTIELSRFISLAPQIDRHRLEKIIVNAAKNNDVQVHIEHKLQTLKFGTDLNVSAAQLDAKTNVIQKMPNEQIRNQLISISRALYSCMEIVNDKFTKERNDKLRREIAAIYQRDEPTQRKEILKRRELIERYKEEKEKESKDRIRQVELATKTRQAERDEEEKARREADQQRRQQEAVVEKEREEHRLAMKVAIDKLRESDIGRKIILVVGEDELYKYDPNSINSLHIDAVIKHSREQKEKLKVQYKKVDFLVRAMHEAEVSLLQKQAEDETNRRREIQQVERVRAIEKSERLGRMDADKNAFLQSIRGQRHEDFVEQMKEYDARLQIARDEALKQKRQEYVEKKKQDFRRERAAKKQQKIDEKKKRLEAEERRKEQERLAERRVADEEKRKKLDEQTRKQREREEEIERRLQAEKEATGNANVRRTAGPPQDKDKAESRPWRRQPRETDENQSNQETASNNRRPEESTSNESWRRKQPTATADRWPTKTSETSDNWRTVEKKRPNPPRPGNDRPSQQQRSDEGAAYRPKPRTGDDQRSGGSGAARGQQSNRADESTSWRARERTRIDSWRANDDQENDDRPSGGGGGGGGSSFENRRRQNQN